MKEGYIMTSTYYAKKSYHYHNFIGCERKPEKVINDFLQDLKTDCIMSINDNGKNRVFIAFEDPFNLVCYELPIMYKNTILYPDIKKELCFETDYKTIPVLSFLDNNGLLFLKTNLLTALNNAAIYHSELLEIALHDDIQAIENEMKERGIILC